MIPIGHEEPDPVQPSILGGPRSLVINGLGYLPKKKKKEPTHSNPPQTLDVKRS